MLIQYLKPLWVKVLLLALLLCGGIGLQLVNPQIIRYFIDTAQAGGAPGALLAAAALFTVLALARQAAALAATYLSEDVGWSATNRLRADLALHCLRLDLSFHKAHAPGELVERVDGDVTTLANFFSQLVIRVASNLFLALGILLLLFWEDWRLGMIGLVYVLLLFALMRGVHHLAVRLWGAAREASARLFGFIEERLVGTEDIRANGAEAYVMWRLYQLMRELLVRQRQAGLMGSFTFVSGWAFYVLSHLGALGVGALLFLDGQISIGTVYLVMYYVGSLETPLNEIRRQVTDLQRAVAGMQRIDELLDVESQVSERRGAPAELPAGPLEVRFEDVCFAYDQRESVLDHVTFRLEQGRVLGLLGRTGSGKTTLTRLLFRLYDPRGGTIRLGGVGIGELPLSDLRQRVGLVTQDVQLFAATLRDNLTFFNRRVPDEQLLHVIAELGLGEWLQSLPAGLDTRLAAGGGGLSAGEAQLLAFTRVFLRDPGLVILDEASSRLDPVTEQLIERAVDRLLQQRTGIIVAHRLGTVQRADDILILEGGRVREYGPRQRLVDDPGSYFSSLLQTGLQEALA